jgi:hypothetical protein
LSADGLAEPLRRATPPMMIAAAAIARAIRATAFRPMPFTAPAYSRLDGWLLPQAEADVTQPTAWKMGGSSSSALLAPVPRLPLPFAGAPALDAYSRRPTWKRTSRLQTGIYGAAAAC